MLAAASKPAISGFKVALPAAAIVYSQRSSTMCSAQDAYSKSMYELELTLKDVAEE
jgi:hypothetical protein